MKLLVAPERALVVPKDAVRRRERRRWVAHRQAYTPRVWPLVLAGFALALAAMAFMGLVAIGYVALVVQVADVVRDWRWKAKHPVLTHEELLEVKRAWAPYN